MQFYNKMSARRAVGALTWAKNCQHSVLSLLRKSHVCLTLEVFTYLEQIRDMLSYPKILQ
jgi:hypothetical protein